MAQAQRVGAMLLARGLRLTTAESCTGGLVAGALTDIEGSSAWFERGFVTYSNAAKTELLGVPPATLERHGAVSEPVAAAMAKGALAHGPADLAVSVTGIAGPGGAVPGKPVGTVCIAFADRSGAVHVETCHFDGARAAVRLSSVRFVLEGVIDWLEHH